MTSKLLSLRAQLQPVSDDAEPGTVDVRLIPFGQAIDHAIEGEPVRLEFSAGDIAHPQEVPVNFEHERNDARSLVGKTTVVDERSDGLYARLKISDTAQGRDALALMRDGVLTDVSAGLLIQDFTSDPITGVLDHVALTAQGAFGKTEDGSKVLAVFTDTDSQPKENTVSDTDVVSPEPTEMALLTAEVTDLRLAMAEMAVPGAIVEPTPVLFANIKEFVMTLAAAAKGDRGAQEKMATFALAGDTTTTNAGLVPDWQSRDIISVIAETRPYIQTLPTDPIGDYGMTLDYPIVTTKPSVDVQATENTEVDSTGMVVGTSPFDIVTIAGANLASRQVVERSAPSYVEAFFAEMAGVYAQKTETLTVAAGVAGAGNTAILADLGADAGATWDAFALAATTIAGGVRRPATDVQLATDRWAQLIGLTDLDGRPLVIFPENGPQNAQGQAGLGTMSGQYGGLMVHHNPDAAVGTCLLYSRSRFQAVAEQNPVQLRAEIVSTLSWELGVYGLIVTDLVKYGAGGYTLTLV